ncbi:hypothetical protein SKAU_G00398580 [Synaphobranchus kaupii]|uniref:Uncharacterized protein n=1 Tax=Synaphobranchus kaupii TaxID=118154 RepID=A0A9Q1E8L5_SYNKA|nr:hypothetical protein SKAU_G00398580 [Synaphobranchus kaupii]
MYDYVTANVRSIIGSRLGRHVKSGDSAVMDSPPVTGLKNEGPKSVAIISPGLLPQHPSLTRPGGSRHPQSALLIYVSSSLPLGTRHPSSACLPDGPVTPALSRL